jgi:uncharacterized membrane protein YgdD (TMEM256/DUF423 family)
MQKIFLILGTVLAGLAVALGAFGAHGLKKLVPIETVSTYQTGVQYQMWHAFALIMVALLIERWTNSQLLHYAGWMFAGGILLFSGSLYFLASMKAMNKVGISGIGLITPLGGLLFIAGWIFVLLAILKNK